MATKVAQFVKDILNKNDDDAKEVQKPDDDKVEEAKLADHENSHRKFERANTNVGAMNKYILQFQYVCRTYQLIEESFLELVQSPTQKSLSDKMKRKCPAKNIRTILNYLGYPPLTDKELQDIFGKDPNSEDTITFKRLLVGSGLCYYLKIAQKMKENLNNANSNHNNNNNNNNNNHNNNNNNNANNNPNSNRFKDIGKGFDIVKNMFDTIDVDGSGEITQNEFRQAFIDVCKDPEIVDARMKELDYNHDKEITFREFLFGIASWVGFDDVDDDDEHDNNDDDDEEEEDEDEKEANKIKANKNSF